MAATNGDEPRAGTSQRCCPLCKFTTADQKQLESHMFSHVDDPMVCEICGYRSLTHSTMARHMKTHVKSLTQGKNSRRAPNIKREISQGRCPLCKFTCTDKKQLESHMLMHAYPIVCKQCGFRALCQNTMEKHMETHTGKDQMFTTATGSGASNTDMSQHSCPFCGFTTTDQQEMESHRFNHMTYKGKPFMCGECRYRASSMFTLQMHMKTHVDEMDMVCEQYCYNGQGSEPSQNKMAANSEPSQDKMAANCNTDMETYTSDTAKYISDVREQHGYSKQDKIKSKMLKNVVTSACEKPLRCEECDYRTHVEYLLRKHMICHTLPFMCGECGHRSALKVQMDIHMRTHTGETPFRCGKCGYDAGNKTRLARHMKIHTGGNFACKKCEYTTTLMGDFNQHLRSHEGEKSFKCDVCGLETSTKGSLARHMIIHDHACCECEYRATCKDDLDRHMQTHRLDKKPSRGELFVFAKPLFMCGRCGLKTTNRGALAVHMKIHDP